MPENTTDRDPLVHLLGSMSDGTSGYIEGMEAAGQRQLVAETTTMPTKGSEGLVNLGFTLGEVHKDDPMFRDVTFPSGWLKQRTDHPMWTKVVDELGRERVSIFYKAAFYDRSAFCRVVSVHSYVWGVVEGQHELVLDDVWATPNAVIEAVREELGCLAEDTAMWRRYEKERDADYSEFIDRNAEKAEKWQAVLDRVTTEGA